MSIVINALSHIYPDGEVLFQNLNLSITKRKKVSLVGHNGVGKSTLLQIIAGRIPVAHGEVLLSEKPYYVPQHLGQYNDCSAAEALGISEKITALRAVLQGNVSAENLEILNDDWDIEERAKSALSYWKLQNLNLEHPLNLMSGGEKTKLFLAGIQIHSPHVILMDEPSNHLDAESRSILYDFISKSKEIILVVSHDRALLNLLDMTLELTHSAIETYGGNYDFYKVQKEAKLHDLESQIEEQEKILRQTKQRAREIAEQQQKREVRGKSQTGKKALPRIIAGGLQGKAEQSSAKLKDSQEEKMSVINDNLSQAREQLQKQQLLRIDLKKSSLHKDKILVDIKSVNHIYGNAPLWKQPLSLQIRSGERIQIEGNNGSGKTTLLKIIMEKIAPSEGSVVRADFRYLYLDQEYSMLNAECTLFEQVQQFNERHLLEHELKTLLHCYQFSRDSWDRKCGLLSGGEKMKLLFCCIMVSDNAPDMLILDEPTNNLDLYSQEILTEAVKHFTGTVLLISHDQYFVEAVEVGRKLRIEKEGHILK